MSENKVNFDITLKSIMDLDVKSDEFFEIYKLVADKHWTVDEPNEYQNCCNILRMFIERIEPEKVILTVKVIEQIMQMVATKSTAVSGNCVFENNNYFFDIYESEVKKDELQSLLGKARKSMANGTMKVGKSQFGKKYF